MGGQSDAYYIEKVKNGHVDAYELLVRRHQHHVFNLIYKITYNMHETEELAQDVFLKAYQSLDGFKQEAKFSTWLYRIAYNAAISHQRKKKIVSLPIEEELVNANWDHAFFDDEDNVQWQREAQLPEALEQLSAESRLLISLYYQQDQSISEIADITSLSESNVKIKLYRSRKFLFEYISTKLEPAKEART